MTLSFMRKMKTGILTCLLCSPALAVEEWRDPETFRINKEAPRSFFYSYNSEAALQGDVPWAQSNHQLLNGEWKFHWVDSPEKRPADFYKADYDDSQWDYIAVPANWEINGYGTPFYHSHACFDNTMTFLTEEVTYNPVGSYRHTFDMPADWANDSVFIHFGAVKSAFYIWINGEKVGYSQDSKTDAAFDISRYVKPGTNTIALEVYRYSDGSYFECQDMWRMSGIERDVYVYTTPKVAIRDFHAYTTLDETYKDGILNFAADIDNRSAKAMNNIKLSATVTDRNGKVVITKEMTIDRLKAGGKTAVAFDAVVKSASLWSAESPNLYRLQLSLLANGQDPQFIARNIGFRSTEYKDGNILINGQPVLFKGVNRHEHDPVSGHVISRESMLHDIQLMKEFNINAVRMSHYPNDPYLYELADKYGLYVMDEANTESHGLGASNQGTSYDPAKHIVNDPKWKAAYIDRISNMYERSKNNPSVVFRSLGNESGDGTNLEATFDWLKAQEPSPVISEQAQLRRHTDAYGQMYAPIRDIVRYAKTQHDERPVILIEYEHAMGNSLGNFQEYWDAFEQYPSLQGGFIWDWVDQTFAKYANDGSFYWAYGGDLEPAGTLHSDSFCANGLVFADRTPYPYLWEVKKVQQNIGFAWADIDKSVITITNKHFFRDLSKYQLRWELLENGLVVESGAGMSLQAPAQKSQQLALNIRHQFDPAKEYFVNLEATLTENEGLLSSGHIVAQEQLAVPFAQPPMPLQANGKVTIADNSDAYTFSGPTFSLTLNKTSGLITDITYRDQAMLTAPSHPEFWRAPVYNDLEVGNYHSQFGVYQYLGQQTKLTELKVVRLANGSVKVSLEHALPAIESRYLSWLTIHGNGEVDVDVWFYAAPHKKFGELPRIGTLFELDKQFNQIQYYGRGPHENYADRKSSAFVGLYSTDVESMYVPYVRPSENGYRTDVRYVEFANQQGSGIRFSAQKLIGFGAEYYSMHDYDATKADHVRRNLHPNDLVERDRIFVNIDYMQRGVGGTDSWGEAPLTEYKLPWLDYRYSFRFGPINKSASQQ